MNIAAPKIAHCILKWNNLEFAKITQRATMVVVQRIVLPEHRIWMDRNELMKLLRILINPEFPRFRDKACKNFMNDN